MKRFEVEQYLGKNVLIYVRGNEVYSGSFYRLRDVNGNEIMEVNCGREDRFLPIDDVLYVIETKSA